MHIIYENPYRYLGVYANSPIKERVANKGKMTAFLSVGKSVSFPLDLPHLLPAPVRTTDAIANADSQLTLPADQVHYALFWWLKASPLDDVAFNHLVSGNTEMAKSIWEKQENVSSLQNRAILAACQGNFAELVNYATKMIYEYGDEFVKIVCGNTFSTKTDTLMHTFVDTLLSELPNEDWHQLFTDNCDYSAPKEYALEKISGNYIAEIENEIAKAEKVDRKSITKRYSAGKTLMLATKLALAQLKETLPTGNIRYQTIADKLALEILQCGSDYYDGSDDDDAAHKAMTLQKFALTTAVGSMAKGRCQEKVDILKKIIASLPPASCISEAEKLNTLCKNLRAKKASVSDVENFMSSCVPTLRTVRDKVGQTNEFYLKISTELVEAALNSLIGWLNERLSSSAYDSNHIWQLLSALEDFDMQKEYITKRFSNQKSAIGRGIGRYSNTTYSTKLDMRTEEKIFSDCKNKKDYKNYIKRFPNSIEIHKKAIVEMCVLDIQVAKSRKGDINNESNDFCNFIGLIVVVHIIFALIYFAVGYEIEWLQVVLGLSIVPVCIAIRGCWENGTSLIWELGKLIGKLFVAIQDRVDDSRQRKLDKKFSVLNKYNSLFKDKSAPINDKVIALTEIKQMNLGIKFEYNLENYFDVKSIMSKAGKSVNII